MDDILEECVEFVSTEFIPESAAETHDMTMWLSKELNANRSSVMKVENMFRKGREFFEAENIGFYRVDRKRRWTREMHHNRWGFSMETVPSPFKPTDGFHDCYLRASSEQRSFVVEVRNLQKWFPEEHEKLTSWGFERFLCVPFKGMDNGFLIIKNHDADKPLGQVRVLMDYIDPLIRNLAPNMETDHTVTPFYRVNDGDVAVSLHDSFSMRTTDGLLQMKNSSFIARMATYFVRTNNRPAAPIAIVEAVAPDKNPNQVRKDISAFNNSKNAKAVFTKGNIFTTSVYGTGYQLNTDIYRCISDVDCIDDLRKEKDTCDDDHKISILERIAEIYRANLLEESGNEWIENQSRILREEFGKDMLELVQLLYARRAKGDGDLIFHYAKQAVDFLCSDEELIYWMLVGIGMSDNPAKNEFCFYAFHMEWPPDKWETMVERVIKTEGVNQKAISEILTEVRKEPVPELSYIEVTIRKED